MKRVALAMTDLRAIAVEYGRWTTTRSHAFLNYADYREQDGPFEFAYYFWAILGSSQPIVVDTGFSRAAGDRRGRTTLIDPPTALAALGIRSDFDGTIVLTHAHYDHIGNVDRFPRARFLMSRTEYDFATSPDADHRLLNTVTEASEIQQLRELRTTGRLALLDEDAELAPGIRLLVAPGHTPGELMVDVDTSDGPVLLTSDVVHFDEELNRDMPFRNMTDLPDAYRSFALVRRLRDEGRLVVAGHEPSVSNSYPKLAGVGFTAVELHRPDIGQSTDD